MSRTEIRFARIIMLILAAIVVVGMINGNDFNRGLFGVVL